MADNEQAMEAGKPPYIAFATVTGFLDKLGEGPMPPRVDRGLLENYSGGTQALLKLTLRMLGVIDENDNIVQPRMTEVAKDEESRKSAFRGMAETVYAEQNALALQNATAQQLYETFGKYGYKGSTLRKAVVFYLALVDYVGLPKSPFFKPPKQTPGEKKPRRTGAGGTTETPPPIPPPPPADTPKGERITVELGTAGTVTMFVDVRWLDLPDETFTALRNLTKDLRGLGPEHPDDEEVVDDSDDEDAA